MILVRQACFWESSYIEVQGLQFFGNKSCCTFWTVCVFTIQKCSYIPATNVELKALFQKCSCIKWTAVNRIKTNQLGLDNVWSIFSSIFPIIWVSSALPKLGLVRRRELHPNQCLLTKHDNVVKINLPAIFLTICFQPVKSAHIATPSSQWTFN